MNNEKFLHDTYLRVKALYLAKHPDMANDFRYYPGHAQDVQFDIDYMLRALVALPFDALPFNAR